MFLLGIVISLSGVCLTLFLKHIPLTVFINPSAILLYTTAILAVLTATQSYKVFGIGLRAAVLPDAPISEEYRGRAASLFRLLSKITGLVSIILVCVGIISAMAHVDDVNGIFEAGAAALAGIVIGLLLIVAVFEPAVAVLKKRQETEHRPRMQY